MSDAVLDDPGSDLLRYAVDAPVSRASFGRLGQER
jgi:hypothetical protein